VVAEIVLLLPPSY
jgi:hypothetical protein